MTSVLKKLLPSLLLLASCGGAPEPYDPGVLHPTLPDVIDALSQGDPEGALALIAERRRLGTAPPGIEHFEGLALADAGRPEEAARAFERELETHPGNGFAHLLLSEACSELGRRDAAESHLAQARKLLGPLPYLELVAARVALAGDHDERAAAAFSAYLSTDRTSPRAAEAHHGLAQLARVAGERAAADAHEARSARIEKAHQYLTSYRQRLAADPSDAEAALGVGMVFLDLYRHVSPEADLLVQAEDALAATTALEPGNLRAHFNLGFTALARGRPADAQAHWSRALEIDAQHPGSLLNLGTLASREDRLDQAADLLSRALSVAESLDDRLRGNLELADVLDRLGQPAGAVAAYEAALALAPGDPRTAEIPELLQALAAQMGR